MLQDRFHASKTHNTILRVNKNKLIVNGITYAQWFKRIQWNSLTWQENPKNSLAEILFNKASQRPYIILRLIPMLCFYTGAIRVSIEYEMIEKLWFKAWNFHHFNYFTVFCEKKYRWHTALCCCRLMFDELLNFTLLRSVFCANIAKIDQWFSCKIKCIFIFEGFSDLKIILNFFFFCSPPDAV